MSVPFDARPLLEPIDRMQARALAKQLRPGGMFTGAFNIVMSITLIAFGLVVVGVVVSLIVGVIVLSFSAVSVVAPVDGAPVDGPGAAPGGGAVAAIAGAVLSAVLFAGITALAVFVSVRSLRARDERWFRLHRFAQANGMNYVVKMADPALPGMIFNVGTARSSSDLLRGAQPRFVEFANYQYTTGSGKNAATHTWGYVAIKLDVPLPHIVLDAFGNNGLFGSNLSASFDKDQHLSLEGDFDRYFSLYCPQGYEADALYLFTPDIMARFIDNAAALDVEIVDDWLFFYSKRSLSTTDPATWAWIFSVVGALLDKLAQWARWRDDRLRMDAAAPGLAGPGFGGPTPGGGAAASIRALPFAAPAGMLRPPPGVAPPGRRLTRKFPWAVLIVVVGAIVTWIVVQTGVMGVLGVLFAR